MRPMIVYLTPTIYEAGVKQGLDMSGYRPTRPIPKSPSPGRGEYPACMPAHGGKCAVCGTGDCLRRPT